MTQLVHGRSTVLQMRDQIVQLVNDGHLRAGDRLPTEADLASTYSVSRGTVREALKLLEQDGLVDVFHGKGRFVSALQGLGVVRPITRFESVTEMLAARGVSATTTVLDARIVRAQKEEAEQLGVEPGHEVVELRRARSVGDEPIVLSRNIFSTDLLHGDEPEPSQFAGSLHEWLKARSREPISSAAHLSAVHLGSDFRDDVSPELRAVPWLLISECGIDQAGAVVLLSKDYHRGDMFGFEVLRRNG
jgi:GntR family transcriptional regulator